MSILINFLLLLKKHIEFLYMYVYMFSVKSWSNMYIYIYECVFVYEEKHNL